MRQRMMGAAALAFLVLAAAWTAPAWADTDHVARNRVKKVEASVEELQNKVTALQLQVQQLQSENKDLRTRVDANYALIRALAKQIGPAL